MQEYHIFTCEDIISSHVRISCRLYQLVTTLYTTDFYVVERDWTVLKYAGKWILDKVTCFALRAIKAWCTAAVESVHLVYTGPAVLTGMTCTVIDICFYRDKVELITNIVYKICNERNKTNWTSEGKSLYPLEEV